MLKDKLRVLLIEDDEICVYSFRKSIRRISEKPVQILHAVTMKEALRFISDSYINIDLIILDLGLPDTEGPEETYNAIMKTKINTPVIVVSALNDNELAQSMIRRGALDYVTKDLIMMNPYILNNAIDCALGKNNKEELKSNYK